MGMYNQVKNQNQPQELRKGSALPWLWAASIPRSGAEGINSFFWTHWETYGRKHNVTSGFATGHFVFHAQNIK